MANKVTYIKSKEVIKEKTLLKIAEKLDIPIKAPCDGKGKCGKCIVKVVSGTVSEPSKAETKLLSDKKLKEGYRLACESTAQGDCTVEW